MRVIILRGPSGAGKSTYAALLTRGTSLTSTIVSADDYFMSGGEYRFDVSRLGEAHGACFRAYIEEIQAREVDLVIVDNTNTTVEEISPYVLGAQAYGIAYEVHDIATDVVTCLGRATHGVPPDGIRAQFSRIVNATLPPWWPVKRVVYGQVQP